VHLPGVALDLYQPTEKDEVDIKTLILENQIDFVGIPCVKKPEEIQNVREKLGIEGAHIKLIARIENNEGLENFDAILQECDGINICRKTLGIDLPAEKVFVAQKWMTWRA
jgi:pyruvate kinase